MKNILKITLYFLLMLGAIYFIYDHYNEINKEEETIVSHQPKNEKSVDIIADLKKKYNNNDIVLLLEIPGVISVPVAQSSNNEYYLTHDIYKNKKTSGAIFLDYRNASIKDKKLIIYGHNSVKETLPFTKLLNYENYDFYKKHPIINIYTAEGKMTYNIFSSYVETNDFDYVNLNEFNGLSYYEHLSKLKNKSKYDTQINLTEDSKIIILQTCTFSNDYNSDIKYQLVMGVLNQENN